MAYWNAKGVVVHKIINPSLLYQIEQKLQIYTYDDICKAIDNYTETYKSKVTWWRHKWTLEEFLKRAGGLQVFLYKTWQDYLDTDAVKKNPSLAVRPPKKEDTEELKRIEKEKKEATEEREKLRELFISLHEEKKEELKEKAKEQVLKRYGDGLDHMRATLPKILEDYEKQALAEQVRIYSITLPNRK